MSLSRQSKWTLFWLFISGMVFCLVLVCSLVSVVNYMGSETFCSTFCHSMNGVAYAWKDGSHSRTPSGKTAGCSDCHLYNASENTLGPIGYVSLLGHKLVAGSHSLYGQVIGRFHTAKMWAEQRPGVEAQEIQWFQSTNYHTCRGCHDLTRMYDAKHPSIGAWHALYIDQPLDCLSCHKDVGHNYKNVDAYIAQFGEYPPLDGAWPRPESVSGASPMPPENLTPEQLKADAVSSSTPNAPKTQSQLDGTSSASIHPSSDASQSAPAAAPAAAPASEGSAAPVAKPDNVSAATAQKKDEAKPAAEAVKEKAAEVKEKVAETAKKTVEEVKKDTSKAIEEVKKAVTGNASEAKPDGASSATPTAKPEEKK